MRKLLVLCVILTGILFFTPGCEPEDTENPDGPPDWDYQASDRDSSSDKDVVQPDENEPDEDEDMTEPDNDNQTGPVCGNEHKEKGEICDSFPIQCNLLNSRFTGTAECRSDCKGYLMDGCRKTGSGIDVYGLMGTSFSTSFILDSTRISDRSYFEKGLISTEAFYGLFGDDFPIPFDYVDTFEVYASSASGSVSAWQFPYWKGEVMPPVIQLEFPQGKIEQRNYTVNAVDMWIFNSYFVRLRVLEQTGNGTWCISMIGYSGKVTVSKAVNTDQADGGLLSFEATDIEFYPVDQLPQDQTAPPEVLVYEKCS